MIFEKEERFIPTIDTLPIFKDYDPFNHFAYAIRVDREWENPCSALLLVRNKNMRHKELI